MDLVQCGAAYSKGSYCAAHPLGTATALYHPTVGFAIAGGSKLESFSSICAVLRFKRADTTLIFMKIGTQAGYHGRGITACNHHT